VEKFICKEECPDDVGLEVNGKCYKKCPVGYRENGKKCDKCDNCPRGTVNNITIFSTVY
jgi:hypothetical protein